MNSPRQSNPSDDLLDSNAESAALADRLTSRQVVICLSGGMDSTGLLLHCLSRGVRVFGISFDYGQKHRLELQRLQANLDYLAEHRLPIEHTQIDVSAIGRLFDSALTSPHREIPEGFYEEPSMKATVVPNRNAIFSSIAYGYALSVASRSQQSVAMALGVHSGDHAIYPDCRPRFYAKIMAAFAAGNWDAEWVNLYLPFLHADKATILRDAQESVATLGLDFDTVFRNTSTSYDPDDSGRSRGRTGADVERILAFAELGIADPLPYTRPWKQVLADAQEMAAAARASSADNQGSNHA